MDEEQYQLMKGAIRKYCAVDLEIYKENQTRRRLAGYLADRKVTAQEYISSLGGNKDEILKLRDFITINVTEFFRDSAHYNELRTNILPSLLKPGKALSIWSAGCSRGAEAYSIAMLLKEQSPLLHHTIVGTDIDDRSLALGRAGGPYPDAELRAIPPDLKAKYFEDDLVAPAVRKMVRFESRNLITAPLAGPFDLIVCRNVVIYFNDEAKALLNTAFAKALKPGGLLFIGATEVLLSPQKFGLQRVSDSFFQRTDAQQKLAA